MPLPVKQRNLLSESPPSAKYIEKQTSIPTPVGKRIAIRLCTDSEHLAKFFAMNWPANILPEKSDATIIALKESPVSYGLSPDFQGSRWFCSKTNQVWMFGNEFYGNIKITVRGLCSEIAPLNQMFMHGCSLSIDGHGVVLSGTSGAGKTTLTTALRQMLGKRAQIVNDDWGICSLADGRLQFTGEPYLHMKYPSVHALAPDLEISPLTHLSENFNGDLNDPRARLLIAAQQVFGRNGLANQVKLHLFVVVIRDPDAPAGARYLSERDVTLIKQGKYSRFYDRTEWFLNGSLFITDKSRQEREISRHKLLLEKFPCVIINNIVKTPFFRTPFLRVSLLDTTV